MTLCANGHAIAAAAVVLSTSKCPSGLPQILTLSCAVRLNYTAAAAASELPSNYTFLSRHSLRKLFEADVHPNILLKKVLRVFHHIWFQKSVCR